MVEFGKLNPDGSYEHVRTLNQSDMAKCPWFIMMPEHYRTDGSCRCNDPEHKEMQEWGYTWNGKSWVAGPDEEE